MPTGMERFEQNGLRCANKTERVSVFGPYSSAINNEVRVCKQWIWLCVARCVERIFVCYHDRSFCEHNETRIESVWGETAARSIEWNPFI